MVEVFTLFEIGAEAAAGARRNALRAQHRHVKKREVPADTDLQFVGSSRCRKRPAVARSDVSQHLLDSANMRLSLLVAAERHPVGRGNVLMDQQTLHSLRERAGVARQAVEVHPKSLSQITVRSFPLQTSCSTMGQLIAN